MNIREIFEKEGLDPRPVNVSALKNKYQFYYVDGMLTTDDVPTTIKEAVLEKSEWINIPCALIESVGFVEDVCLNLNHVKKAYKVPHHWGVDWAEWP